MRYVGALILAALVVIWHIHALAIWTADHPVFYWWAFYRQATLQDWLSYHSPLFGNLLGCGVAAALIIWFMLFRKG